VLGRIPLYALLFVAMTLFGTVGALFDHISITLRSSDQVLTRNVLNGVVTLGLVALLPLVTGRASSFTIFAAWVAGNLSCGVLGFVQLGRALPGYHYRPYLGLPLARQLLGIGLPNWALTLAERAPGPIMPVVVTELLSPVANARWYAVWMISWVVFIVPISVGQTLFAAAARQTGGLRAEVFRSIRSYLGLGCVMAAGVVVTAPLMLWFLGDGAPARCGYRPRLPYLVISPYARPTFVDHSLIDQTSTIRFIEDNWLHGRRLGAHTFDARAGAINAMFDFAHPRRDRLILNLLSGENR
jgi:O-antigen/teichoic acid export membrane protein